ncbi:hypothetical protein CXF68_19915 [Tenacibaculum sp. Bg11-29]|uniref:DUF2931 family protein n=1 Tax=Tenacibaculum sp. Bg11-29 TaxID=2058306 RepID=UPI000C32192A|nr:DUF2931 family protein [Tenacibaculum sp. Bg11-29]PKH52822.1 hypothetical protein CXF68_19915 [Tenacibaculum sp. Bg11-29]
MKIKLNILLVFFAFILINCKGSNMDKKYKWSVSVNAPKNFPATLHYGYLGETGIRGKGTLNSGWGLTGSFTGSQEKRALPKELHLVWISYLENQFYEGHFELDHKKIAKIFEKGFKEDTDKGVIMSHDMFFVVNVAPGGTVAVWLMGIDGFQREVGFYQAKKTKVVWKEYNPHGEQDREKSVKIYTDAIPPEIVTQYKENKLSFKKWETYREPFTWSAGLKGNPHMVFLNAYAFNGEEYRIHQNFLKIKEDTIYSALPRKIKMQWEEPDQVKECFTATCIFKESDYATIATAFKENNHTGSFEIVPYVENNVKKLKLYLITGTKKQEIHLKENKVKRVFYK